MTSNTCSQATNLFRLEPKSAKAESAFFPFYWLIFLLLLFKETFKKLNI